MRQPSPSRPGFTLFDLMITITVMIIMAAVLIPHLQDNTQLRIIAASRLLSSDIEVAQVMTIGNPQEPIVVRLSPDDHEYWLATAADPETPIKRPGSVEDYRVTFGKGRARSAAGVQIALVDLPHNALAFNAQGGVAELNTQPEIKLLLGTRWIKLGIAPITGSISETDGEE
jgi:type II secretory pathway pseudopilin PulG